MLTKTIRELYIPSTVEEISDNMCGTLVTISHLYYDGSFDDFEKIKFTSFSRWKSLKTKIKRLSVKNDKDEYYKVMTNTESLYETRGIDLSLLNTLLARDEEKIVKACEERLNNNSYISYVSYYDDFFRIIIEAKYDTLSNEIKEFLYDNKICILADDCLINYRVDRFTKVTPMPNYKEDKRHPAPPSILMNEVGRFSYSTKVVNISKDTKTIGKEFSEEAHHVVIYYDGLVEDWFNIEVNCDLKGYIVRCIDGTIQYVSVNHNKVDFELYYSGVHLLNSYIIRYVNTLSFRKVFWGFVDHNLLAAIASNNSHKMKSYAHNYHDYNDDEEYNIYDYHNFKKIKVFDFEAG